MHFPFSPSSLLSLLTFVAASQVVADENRHFPPDPCVLDAKRDFGAKADGVADDTAALQSAIEASCGTGKGSDGVTHALYLPNGVYRVTRTLVVKNALGPWLYGESRDGVVIKLTDGSKDVTAVLRTHPSEKGPTSADWFMRNLRHFTIDVGNNPTTDGIRYYATNSGCLKDLRVIGHGKIGINAGFLDQSGPNLIQDVEIDGFETGILSQWIWSETISRVIIKNCRKLGLSVTANVVAAEALTVENTPQAVLIDATKGEEQWCGLSALVGCRFTGGDSKTPAILNLGKLYVRDLKTSGFQQALSTNGSGGSIDGHEITEFSSSKIRTLFPDSTEGSLGLAIKPEPVIAWENEPNHWICANDFGAKAGDNADDTDAVQKAMDAAAEKGASVVYFRGCGGRDPNWYQLSRVIKVPAPVRMVMGLGWARLLLDNKEKVGGFEIDDHSAPGVKFQNIDSFGGTPIRLINAAKTNVLVVESCGVHVIGKGSGDIFLTDVPGTLDLQTPGQHCWARQFNPEGTSDDGLVKNNGASLWCLGVKHEGKGVRFSTCNGGKTELLGVFNYGGTKEELDPRPSFQVTDASFSMAAYREIAFDQHTALNKVKETRAKETRVLDKNSPNAGGWISWSLLSASKP